MARDIRLTPVDANFSLKDHIHALLRAAILEMDIYDPKTDLRLDERGLAEKLGISRTPVREALVRLEQEGFVEIQPRKGVFVVRKSRDDVLEMITAWAALESMAAALAADRATDEQLSELRALGTRFDPSGATANISEYSEDNIAFHQKILQMSACGLLVRLANDLFLHMRAIRNHAMPEADRAMRSVADHMAVIEALEARDPDLAARRVREHTMRLHDHVRAHWSLAISADGARVDGTRVG